MSFILDQLKKSGKRRALELAMLNKAETRGKGTEETPNTPCPSAAGPGIQLRSSLLLIFLTAVLFTIMGSVLLYRGKTGSQPAPPVTRKPEVRTPVPSAPQAESALQMPALSVERETSRLPRTRSNAGSKTILPDPAAVKPIQARKINKPAPPAAAPESWIQTPYADREQSRTPVQQEKPGPRENENRTPYLNELPAALRNALPPVQITSHLYRGNSRLVNINGRIMSQGVTMDDGLFLEEITQEGVILSFRGHRFRVRAE